MNTSENFNERSLEYKYRQSVNRKDPAAVEKFVTASFSGNPYATVRFLMTNKRIKFDIDIFSLLDRLFKECFSEDRIKPLILAAYIYYVDKSENCLQKLETEGYFKSAAFPELDNEKCNLMLSAFRTANSTYSNNVFKDYNILANYLVFIQYFLDLLEDPEQKTRLVGEIEYTLRSVRFSAAESKAAAIDYVKRLIEIGAWKGIANYMKKWEEDNSFLWANDSIRQACIKQGSPAILKRYLSYLHGDYNKWREDILAENTDKTIKTWVNLHCYSFDIMTAAAQKNEQRFNTLIQEMNQEAWEIDADSMDSVNDVLEFQAETLKLAGQNNWNILAYLKTLKKTNIYLYAFEPFIRRYNAVTSGRKSEYSFAELDSVWKNFIKDTALNNEDIVWVYMNSIFRYQVEIRDLLQLLHNKKAKIDSLFDNYQIYGILAAPYKLEGEINLLFTPFSVKNMFTYSYAKEDISQNGSESETNPVSQERFRKVFANDREWKKQNNSKKEAIFYKKGQAFSFKIKAFSPSGYVFVKDIVNLDLECLGEIEKQNALTECMENALSNNISWMKYIQETGRYVYYESYARNNQLSVTLLPTFEYGFDDELSIADEIIKTIEVLMDTGNYDSVKIFTNAISVGDEKELNAFRYINSRSKGRLSLDADKPYRQYKNRNMNSNKECFWQKAEQFVDKLTACENLDNQLKFKIYNNTYLKVFYPFHIFYKKLGDFNLLSTMNKESNDSFGGLILPVVVEYRNDNIEVSVDKTFDFCLFSKGTSYKVNIDACKQDVFERYEEGVSLKYFAQISGYKSEKDDRGYFVPVLKAMKFYTQDDISNNKWQKYTHLFIDMKKTALDTINFMDKESIRSWLTNELGKEHLDIKFTRPGTFSRATLEINFVFWSRLEKNPQCLLNLLEVLTQMKLYPENWRDLKISKNRYMIEGALELKRLSEDNSNAEVAASAAKALQETFYGKLI